MTSSRLTGPAPAVAAPSDAGAASARGRDADPWSRVLPPPEGRVWFRRIRFPIRLWRLGAMALFVGLPVTLLVLYTMSWTYFATRPERLLDVLIVGPLLAFAYELAVEPYRIGIGPRGLWLRSLPRRDSFFPWGFLTPEDVLDGRPQLRLIAPRTLVTDTMTLASEEAEAILGNSWSRDWVFRDEATRRWGLGRRASP